MEDLRPRISEGNAKMKDTFLWSLPPVITCPGATTECKKFCYAIDSFMRYPTVRNAWDINYELTKRDDFVEIMLNYLNGILKSKRKAAKIIYFRVHESGDFYNQDYVNKFAEIARSLPEINFLAYTKSGWLDFSVLPDNFVIRLSVWQDSNDKLIYKLKENVPWAILEGMEEIERDETFYCAPKMQCHKDCDRFCWASKEDVKFTKVELSSSKRSEEKDKQLFGKR